MTEKVNPSPVRPAEAFKTAGAIAYGGHSEEGFVIDGSSPTELSIQQSDIDETALTTFAESSSSSSFDVTIDAGEAFVFGSWLATDTSTTVTLSSSTTSQAVYLGWNKDGTDDVLIGTESAFDDSSSSADKRVLLYEFDTDSSGVTAVEDYRRIGQAIRASEIEVEQAIDAEQTVRIAASTGMTISGPTTVDGQLHVDGSFTDTIGPIYGDGEITGTGTIRTSGLNNELEPIDATIDTNTFVAISGWTTDNDADTYDAYRFARGGSIEIEQNGALTLTI